jgi:hypothetical protein
MSQYEAGLHDEDDAAVDKVAHALYNSNTGYACRLSEGRWYYMKQAIMMRMTQPLTKLPMPCRTAQRNAAERVSAMYRLGSAGVDVVWGTKTLTRQQHDCLLRSYKHSHASRAH